MYTRAEMWGRSRLALWGVFFWSALFLNAHGESKGPWFFEVRASISHNLNFSDSLYEAILSFLSEPLQMLDIRNGLSDQKPLWREESVVFIMANNITSELRDDVYAKMCHRTYGCNLEFKSTRLASENVKVEITFKNAQDQETSLSVKASVFFENLGEHKLEDRNAVLLAVKSFPELKATENSQLHHITLTAQKYERIFLSDAGSSGFYTSMNYPYSLMIQY